jgi:hypothetical protein
MKKLKNFLIKKKIEVQKRKLKKISTKKGEKLGRVLGTVL